MNQSQVNPFAEGDTANLSGTSTPNASEVHLDGQVLGEWMLNHLELALRRPPTTANFVSRHRTSIWPGQPIAV
jgi:hypothetical protein